MKDVSVITVDVLVIGGGGAGLRAAIEARKKNLNVLIVSSSRIGCGNNTAISRGALAAATDWIKTEDNPAAHLRDILKSGRFLSNQRLAEVMVRGAKQQVRDLIEYGVKFQESDGKMSIRQAPGHSYARTFYCVENLGTGFTFPMLEYAQRMGVQFKNGIYITRILRHDGVASGAIGLDRNGQLIAFNAKSVVLATGGAGRLFLRTNNTTSSNGTGYSLAYEAGAPLMDMEFTQFYPTALAEYSGYKMVLYETLVARGGALIKNSLGEDIPEKYGIKDPYLMTRDALTRAIMGEILQGRATDGAVVMDLTHVSEQTLSQHFPFLVRKVHAGITILPVAPTAHYQMGGVRIDESGRTAVPALYAAGEVCGGVHGANRLASNSITEILVFGAIAGDNAAQNALEVKLLPIRQSELSEERKRLESMASSAGNESVRELIALLSAIMWYKVGIIREAGVLGQALDEINSIQQRQKRVSIKDPRQLIEAIELNGMLTTARMMTRAALIRTESRGSHYRSDYPKEDNEHWLKYIEISAQSGEMALKVIPIEGGTKYSA